MHCSSLSCPEETLFLPLETITEVIDDAIALGCECVNLSGGEPFVYPDLVQIVRYVHGKGVKCLVYTSGIGFEKEKPSPVSIHLLNELHGMVDKYIVNVEAADESTYNQIMGTEFQGFGMMCQFIQKAVEIGEIVEAHFVPTKLNYRQIPAVVEMCKTLGVSRVSFLRFVAQGRGLDNVSKLLLDETEIKETRLLMKECLANKIVVIRIGIPFIECDKRVNCLAGISKLDVRYDGKVYPCEAFKNENLKHLITSEADNVKEKSLQEIYRISDHLIQARKLLGEFQTQMTCETCMNQFYTKHNQNESR